MDNPQALTDTEPLRVAFYKAVASFVRAYADIAQHLETAGYSPADIDALPKEVEFYGEVRSAIKKHSGEELDIKPYEADMRHLLNTYVQADPAQDLGNLNSLSLTELIVETGIHDAIARKLNQQGKLSRNAIAEGSRRNETRTVIKLQATHPRLQQSQSLGRPYKWTRGKTDVGHAGFVLVRNPKAIESAFLKYECLQPIVLALFTDLEPKA